MRRIAPLFLTLLLIVGAPAYAGEPQIGLTLETQGDAFVVNARVELPVSLGTAWDVLTDFEHMVGILSNLSSSQVVARNGTSLNVVQQGTVRYGIFSYAFASEREVRLEPMTRIFSRQISGTAKHYASEMRLSSTDQGTKLRYRVNIVPDSALARAFGASFVEHEVSEQLAALAAEMLRREAR